MIIYAQTASDVSASASTVVSGVFSGVGSLVATHGELIISIGVFTSVVVVCMGFIGTLYRGGSNMKENPPFGYVFGDNRNKGGD